MQKFDSNMYYVFAEENGDDTKIELWKYDSIDAAMSKLQMLEKSYDEQLLEANYSYPLCVWDPEFNQVEAYAKDAPKAYVDKVILEITKTYEIE